MITQASPPKTSNKHAKFIERYVRFDAPSKMPSIFASWHEPLDKATERAISYGLRVATVDKPVEGYEIIGRSSRVLLRDYALARKRPQADIALYDQFSIFEMESFEDANEFIELLIAKIRDTNLQITVLERSSKTRRLVIESAKGYRMLCVTVINSIFDVANEDKSDLFIHWTLEYDKSARKSNNQVASGNLFDGTEIA